MTSGSVAVHRGGLGFPVRGGGGGGGGGGERRKRVEDEDDEEEENGEQGMEAWERAYADERSWEALQEDESGLLRPIDTKTLVHSQYRRRLRLRLRSNAASSAAPRIQKGLIRYLYVVIDLSRAASETDFRPSRMVVVSKCVEAFIREFFDQNPLSHIGIVTIKDGVAQRLTDLGGSPDSQIKPLLGKLECSGDASLQNALELVHGYLNQIPSYGHREVLVLYSALNTCDPGDIMETIQECKKAKIRCSVIGLSAEIYTCKHLSEETGGSYTVALDESHFKELLLEHAPPPPAIAEYAAANLIKMGFPRRGAEVTPFNEVSSMIRSKLGQMLPQTCYGCQQSLVSHVTSNGKQH
ncbi:general transcription factor IIH subunit 2 [Cocos nucifera]|uniref:General transcription factor IIH subunit 2 n=1 Tax=Cocos nucifera TaxID=13894 RepID=A0A8K0ILN5_COCNU|nr:general transcription factor IIH subunit 2 [Cocos nucifera]